MSSPCEFPAPSKFLEDLMWFPMFYPMKELRSKLFGDYVVTDHRNQHDPKILQTDEGFEYGGGNWLGMEHILSFDQLDYLISIYYQILELPHQIRAVKHIPELFKDFARDATLYFASSNMLPEIKRQDVYYAREYANRHWFLWELGYGVACQLKDTIYLYQRWW